MIADVYIDGKRVRLDPSRAIGKGGEADVFDLGDGRALKVYKSPDHPDYRDLPNEQRAAEARITVHQEKLRAFPRALPPEVIAPEALATDRSGRTLLGYAMRLVSGSSPLRSYSDPAYRRTVAPTSDVVRFFVELARIVRSLHAGGVVIGDFNDLNVLVSTEGRPRLIDTDSFQFGVFACTVFTEAFVDPRLCDATAEAPLLTKRYDEAADWHAYAALLFQSLLFVGPWGGVYRPNDASKRKPHRRRPLERITVFHPEVRYPKPAVRPDVLPEELVHYFQRVFEHDERGPFPVRLLEALRLSTCTQCGIEHARVACPRCSATLASTAAPATELHVETLFRSTGLVIAAAFDGDVLRVVTYDDGAYRREDGTAVLAAPLDPALRFRLLGTSTLLGKAREVSLVSPGLGGARWHVDTDGAGGPAFDTNQQHRYWVRDGRLHRDDATALDRQGTMLIGDVLADQTRIFAGPTFGIGLYRAGTLTRAFVFDAERRLLNDEVRLVPLHGEVVEVSAALDEHRAWLFVSVAHAGRTRNICSVYGRSGELEAVAEADASDGSWLGTLRGKCAAGGALFSATDDGIVRLEARAGTIELTRRFSETAELVDAHSTLLVGRRSLCIVRRQDIIALKSR